MRPFILPALLVIAGLGLGIAAGLAMRPPAEEATGDAQPSSARPTEFVRLGNQFVVPLMTRGRVDSLVVLSLGIEVAAGRGEIVHSREPKLRDALLQVLFDHANAGGFRGAFTEGHSLVALRLALREAAGRVLGADATDVLIMDVLRQDS